TAGIPSMPGTPPPGAPAPETPDTPDAPYAPFTLIAVGFTPPGNGDIPGRPGEPVAPETPGAPGNPGGNPPPANAGLIGCPSGPMAKAPPSLGRRRSAGFTPRPCWGPFDTSGISATIPVPFELCCVEGGFEFTESVSTPP